MPPGVRAYQMDNMAEAIYLGQTNKPKLELYLQVRGPVRLAFEYDSPLPFRSALDPFFGPASPKASFAPDSSCVVQGWTVKEDASEDMGPYRLPLGWLDRSIEFVYGHPWWWILLGTLAATWRLSRRDKVRLLLLTEPPTTEVSSLDGAVRKDWRGQLWVDRGRLGDAASLRVSKPGYQVHQETIPAAWFAQARRGASLQWGPIRLQPEGQDLPVWELKIGETVAGYRILQRLGEGVSAVVYRVVPLSAQDGTELALKLLKPSELRGTDAVGRFRREMAALSKLQHPNIPYLSDYGEYRGMFYLCMELLQGSNLAELPLPLPLPTTRHILRQLATALSHAHGFGILHRDIKPGNVVLSEGNLAKLTDFGLARAQDSNTLTMEGTLLGTPAYMAPEVANGQPGCPQSDMYSLACLSLEILSGNPPYSGDSPLAVIFQQIQGPIPDVSALCPDLPSPLALCLQKMLAKAPEQRPANFQELLCALDS